MANWETQYVDYPQFKTIEGSVLSVWYDLYINSKQVDETRKNCITSIEISEVDTGTDSLTLNISDPDMLYIEDDIYKEDVPIKLDYGWNEDTFTKSFEGYISAIDIDFPDTGTPTLTITCMDKSHLMNKKKRKRSWDNVTNADVVKSIAAEYGFKCVVEPDYEFKEEETISQDATDLEFITSLSDNELELFMCKLIGDTIYYIKRGVISTPVLECTYKEYPWDLVSFTPQINTETKKEEIEEEDIDEDYKEPTGSSASSDSDSSLDKSEPKEPKDAPNKGIFESETKYMLGNRNFNAVVGVGAEGDSLFNKVNKGKSTSSSKSTLKEVSTGTATATGSDSEYRDALSWAKQVSWNFGVPDAYTKLGNVFYYRVTVSGVPIWYVVYSDYKTPVIVNFKVSVDNSKIIKRDFSSLDPLNAKKIYGPVQGGSLTKQ